MKTEAQKKERSIDVVFRRRDNIDLLDYSGDRQDATMTQGAITKELDRIDQKTKDYIHTSMADFQALRHSKRLMPGKTYVIEDYISYYYPGMYDSQYIAESLYTHQLYVTADSVCTILETARTGEGDDIRITLFDEPLRDENFKLRFDNTWYKITGTNRITYSGQTYYEFCTEDNLHFYITEDKYSRLMETCIVNARNYSPEGKAIGEAYKDGDRLVLTTEITLSFPADECLGYGEITWMQDSFGNESPFDSRALNWRLTQGDIDNIVITGREEAVSLSPDILYKTFSGCRCCKVEYQKSAGILRGPYPIVLLNSDNTVVHSYETIIFVNRSRFNEVHFDTDVNTTLSSGYSYVTCGRDTVMYHHLEEKQDRKNVVYSGSGNVTLIHSHIVHVKMEGSCTFRLTKPEGMHGLEYTYDIVLETSSPVYSVSFPSDILWEVPLSLEANRRYEISIRDNVALWTSSEIPVVQ